MNWPLWKVTTPSCPLALAKSIPIAFAPVSVNSTICVSSTTLSTGMSIIAIIAFRRAISSGEPLSQIAFKRRSIAIDGVDRLAERLVARPRRLGRLSRAGRCCR